jgi:hypothetical protein
MGAQSHGPHEWIRGEAAGLPGDWNPVFSFAGRRELGMQTTIYYSDEDAYLIKQVDAKGKRERKSRSSVILSILEQHFECEKRLGEILIDLGVMTHTELAKGLQLQQTKFTEKLLGDILLEEELVPPEAVERALMIQARGRKTESASS